CSKSWPIPLIRSAPNKSSGSAQSSTPMSSPSQWPTRRSLPASIENRAGHDATGELSLEIIRGKGHYRVLFLGPLVTTFDRSDDIRPGVQASGYCRQHFLYFLPLPHGQGSLRPTFSRRGDTWRSCWVRSALDCGDQPAGRSV